ncbi:MAG TPA: twin-arginine translocase TatA/TatE family subunit [Chloroflexota bacterium]|nr:twin-arginine translocase TatA/TatE family subunit [Chloroflexota bacterium]
MPTIGVWELVVILVIVVVILGAGRLSEVGGALGKGIREFRKATTNDHAPALPPQPTAPPPAPTVVVENTCPSCGTLNPPAQAFCGQCGTRLTRAA